MQAMDLLVERGGKDVIKETRALFDSTTDYPAVQALWVLERLGALTEKDLDRSLSASWNLIRIHAARVLGERAQWGPGDRALALRALEDAAPLVKRAAVEALGAHPQPENIPLLLSLLQAQPRADTHMMHTLRMALRDQLKSSDAWAGLAK